LLLLRHLSPLLADESEDEDEDGDEAILGTADDGMEDEVLEGSDGDEAGRGWVVLEEMPVYHSRHRQMHRYYGQLHDAVHMDQSVDSATAGSHAELPFTPDLLAN
jgi:hypothetical protein